MFANDAPIFLWKFPDELLCTIFNFDLHKEPRLQLKFFLCFFP
jgi:HD-like signal output (HDOD) protein